VAPRSDPQGQNKAAAEFDNACPFALARQHRERLLVKVVTRRLIMPDGLSERFG